MKLVDPGRLRFMIRKLWKSLKETHQNYIEFPICKYIHKFTFRYLYKCFLSSKRSQKLRKKYVQSPHTCKWQDLFFFSKTVFWRVNRDTRHGTSKWQSRWESTQTIWKYRFGWQLSRTIFYAQSSIDRWTTLQLKHIFPKLENWSKW